MSCFNSIWVDCPRCGNPVEFQSKSGTCSMASYSIHHMPAEDFAGIAGNQECCDDCGFVVAIKDPRDEQCFRSFYGMVY